jgi:hypothetical protein
MSSRKLYTHMTYSLPIVVLTDMATFVELYSYRTFFAIHF